MNYLDTKTFSLVVLIILLGFFFLVYTHEPSDLYDQYTALLQENKVLKSEIVQLKKELKDLKDANVSSNDLYFVLCLLALIIISSTLIFKNHGRIIS